MKLKLLNISFLLVTLFFNFSLYPQNPNCKWESVSNSYIARFESQSTTVNGKLYVISGFLRGTRITDLVEIYDLVNNSWTFGSPIPIGVSHMGIVVIETDIWILGGFIGNNPGVATNKVQIYNTINDTWRDGPDLPSPRASGGASYLDGRIHFFGGLLPDRQTDVDEHYFIETTNLASGWQTAKNMPIAKNHFSVAVINGLIYALGGQQGHDLGNDDLKSVYAYDFNNNNWINKADLPEDRSHFESATIVHNDKIIIAGGENASNYYNNILQYDPSNDSWSELCTMPNPLLAPVLSIIGNTLIIGNGFANNSSSLPTNNFYKMLNENTLSISLDSLEKIVLLYPNPFVNKFTLKTNNLEKIKRIEICDITGRFIEQIITDNTSEIEINLSGEAKGLYLIKIIFESDEVIVKKLIKS